MRLVSLWERANKRIYQNVKLLLWGTSYRFPAVMIKNNLKFVAHQVHQVVSLVGLYKIVWHCFHFFPTVVPNSTKVIDEEKKFRDCADLYQAGVHKNGVYTIQINPQETKKVQSHNILQPAGHWLMWKYLHFSTSGPLFHSGFHVFSLSWSETRLQVSWWVWMMGGSCCRNIDIES